MRILVAAHNHPALHPGGTEIFAHDLFRAYQRAGHEALFLGATNQVHRQIRPGTSFQGLGDARDEVLLWSGHFDRFYMSQVDLYGVVPDLVELLSGLPAGRRAYPSPAADRRRVPAHRPPDAAGLPHRHDAA